MTDYEFNRLDRHVKIEYDKDSSNPTPKQQSVFGYDEISRLLTATNSAGTVSFAYDTRNRVESTTDVFGHLLEYTYLNLSTDDATVKLDNGLCTTYRFDNAGRLWKAINASDSATVTFGYDNENKLTSRAYPNGTTNYVFDGMDRQTQLKVGGPVQIKRTYSYNDASQIEMITEGPNTKMFGYDEADRLKTVTASNNQNETYAYDSGPFANKVGNRTSSHLSTAYGYEAYNRLTPADNGTYSCNANGNMYQKWDGKRWRYTWDHENRLTAASNGKMIVTDQYDALWAPCRSERPRTRRDHQIHLSGRRCSARRNDGVQTKYLNVLGVPAMARSFSIASTMNSKN